MEISIGNPHSFVGILWEFPIDDFVVLVRPQTPGLFILSPSATFIWDLLKTGAPVEGIVNQFASVYEIPRALAEEDVTRTLDDWRSSLLSGDRESSFRIAIPSEVPASSTEDF